MELSNYLRPGYINQQQREYTNRLKEELFNLYENNLGHQMIDHHDLPQLTLPINYEGLGCEDYIGEQRMAQIFEKIDGNPIANKLLELMQNAGWHLSSYCEDGILYITVEGADYGREEVKD